MTIRDILETLQKYVDESGDKEEALSEEVYVFTPDDTYAIAGVTQDLIGYSDQEPQLRQTFVVQTED